RSHSRLHHDWFRSWRGPGRGANGDVGKPAILEAPRRRSRPPDDSGRTRSTLFECAAWVRTIGAPKSDSTSSRPEIAAPKLRLETLTSLLVPFSRLCRDLFRRWRRFSDHRNGNRLPDSERDRRFTRNFDADRKTLGKSDPIYGLVNCSK